MLACCIAATLLGPVFPIALSLKEPRRMPTARKNNNKSSALAQPKRQAEDQADRGHPTAAASSAT